MLPYYVDVYCQVFSRGEFADINVVNGIGSLSLTCFLSALARHAHISEVSLDDAMCAARDLTDTTSRTAQLIPSPTRIGGVVRMVLVGKDVQEVP